MIQKDRLNIQKYKSGGIGNIGIYYRHENNRLSLAEINFVYTDNYKYITMKDVYYFSRINVVKEYRGIGIGRYLLKELLREVKRENIALVCEISPYGEMGYTELKNWYIRNGFIEKNNLLWYNI